MRSLTPRPLLRRNSVDLVLCPLASVTFRSFWGQWWIKILFPPNVVQFYIFSNPGFYSSVFFSWFLEVLKVQAKFSRSVRSRYDWTHLVFSLWLTLEWWFFVSTFSLFVITFLLTLTLTGGLRKDHRPWYRFFIVWNCVAELCSYSFPLLS